MGLAQQLLQALRRVGRAPALSLVAVLTLGVGIGATSAIFSVVDGVLLRPLSYGDAGRLVALFAHETRKGERRNPTSPADFREWQRASRSLEGLTAAHPWSPVLSGRGLPEELPALKATAGLFDLLGVAPALGRAFREGDGDAQVVLGHDLWRRRFDADPAIVGQSLTLDGRSYVVVAVMPAGFRFPPFWATDASLWVPPVFGGALALSRLLRGVLHEVSPTDPLTFAVAVLVLLAVAASASFFPALRASRVDPVTTLREV